jgi:hypothetical protein
MQEIIILQTDAENGNNSILHFSSREQFNDVMDKTFRLTLEEQETLLNGYLVEANDYYFIIPPVRAWG